MTEQERKQCYANLAREPELGDLIATYFKITGSGDIAGDVPGHLSPVVSNIARELQRKFAMKADGNPDYKKLAGIEDGPDFVDAVVSVDVRDGAPVEEERRERKPKRIQAIFIEDDDPFAKPTITSQRTIISGFDKPDLNTVFEGEGKRPGDQPKRKPGMRISDMARADGKPPVSESKRPPRDEEIIESMEFERPRGRTPGARIGAGEPESQAGDMKAVFGAFAAEESPIQKTAPARKEPEDAESLLQHEELASVQPPVQEEPVEPNIEIASEGVTPVPEKPEIDDDDGNLVNRGNIDLYNQRVNEKRQEKEEAEAREKQNNYVNGKRVREEKPHEVLEKKELNPELVSYCGKMVSREEYDRLLAEEVKTIKEEESAPKDIENIGEPIASGAIYNDGERESDFDPIEAVAAEEKPLVRHIDDGDSGFEPVENFEDARPLRPNITISVESEAPSQTQIETEALADAVTQGDMFHKENEARRRQAEPQAEPEQAEADFDPNGAELMAAFGNMEESQAEAAREISETEREIPKKARSWNISGLFAQKNFDGT